MGEARSLSWENLVISLEITLSWRKENNSYSEVVSVYSVKSFTYLASFYISTNTIIVIGAGDYSAASKKIFCRFFLKLWKKNQFWGILYKRRECMETAAHLNDSGIALTEANRPYEAIPLFRKALIMEPENPLLWLNLGIAQQRTGEYGEALDSYQRAVNINDDLTEAWLSMGLIYYELEIFDSAEECYHHALERDPDSPKTWNNLGVLYFSEGCYEEARHCFEEALSLLPMYYDALFNLRDTCRELGDYRAAAEFERVLSQSGSRNDSPATGLRRTFG